VVNGCKGSPAFTAQDRPRVSKISKEPQGWRGQHCSDARAAPFGKDFEIRLEPFVVQEESTLQRTNHSASRVLHGSNFLGDSGGLHSLKEENEKGWFDVRKLEHSCQHKSNDTA